MSLPPKVPTRYIDRETTVPLLVPLLKLVMAIKRKKKKRITCAGSLSFSKRVESQFRRSNKLFDPVESFDGRRPLPSPAQDLIQWKRSAFNATRAAAFARSVTIDRLQTYPVSGRGHMLNASF